MQTLSKAIALSLSLLAPRLHAEKTVSNLNAILEWGVPSIEQYYPRDTLIRGEISGFAQMPNDEIAVLTTLGISYFDGTNWEHIREIDYLQSALNLPDRNLLAVGCRRGIAMITPDGFGGYRIETPLAAFCEEHNIPQLDRIAYARGHFFGLRGSGLVVLYPDGNAKYFQLQNWATSIFASGDDIYFTGGSKSLVNGWDWESETLVNKSDILDGAGIYRWLVDSKPRLKGGAWLLTNDGEIIVFDGITTTRWKGSKVLKALGTRITSLEELSADTLAVGTAAAGLLVIDPEGKITAQYSRKQGADDTHVYKIGQDSQSGIWIATESAVTRIDANSSTLLFDERQGLTESINCIQIFNNRIYLGTPYGLFASNEQTSDPARLFTHFQSTANVEDMVVVGDELWLAGDVPMIIKNDGSLSEINTPGFNSLLSPRTMPETVIVSEFRGVRRFDRESGAWIDRGLLNGPNVKLQGLAEASDGTIFGSTGSDQLAKIRLDANGGEIELITLPAQARETWTTCLEWKGDIYIDTEPMLRWDSEAQAFVDDPTITTFPGVPPYGFKRLFGRSSQDAWVAQNTRSSKTNPRPSLDVVGKVSSLGYSIDTRANCLVYDDHGNAYLGGPFGLVIHRPSENGETVFAVKPKIHSIRTLRQGKQLPVTAPQGNPAIIAANDRSFAVQIEFTKFYNAPKSRYQIFIEGVDAEWADFDLTTKREINNLAPGNYVIRFRAQDSSSRTYSGDNYYIRVLTPWYSKSWAYGFYALAAFGFVTVSTRIYSKTQIERSRRLETIVKERTAEVEKQNLELASQAERLERQNEELEEKTEELTATTQTLTQTLQQLQEMQDQLVATARTAGKAEIAINVLHNVGNALNSINVSLSVISRKVAESKVWRLFRLASIIEEQRAEFADSLAHSPRGKALPDYLIALSKTIEEEMKKLKQELSIMGDDVDHVKSIIAAQQTHAKNQHINETFNLSQLVDVSLTILGSDNTPSNIEIVNDLPPSLEIHSDKHLLLEILHNLISNARDAIVEQSPDIGIISITAATDETAGQLELRVKDNGKGFEKTLVKRLFQHGFTTKADGHGFGLHSSANSAGSLGGSIRLKSDGIGKGATAILTLPLKAVAKPEG